MSLQDIPAPRAVIVISSHVARGSVGNRAAVFALETLGHPVWAVPTVILPWHPGHGRATRIVPDDAAFSALIDDLEGAPWAGEVGAILSGYLGSAAQAESVARLVSSLKGRNPALRYVCDPVIGDSGGLYVPAALAAAIRDRLLPLADIATPNRFELQWIVQAQLDTPRAVMEAALMAGPPMMLVTSAPAMMAGGIGNLLVTPSHAWLAEHRMIERPPNGLGDLTAAVFLARLMAGEKPDKALQTTTASVFEILARTAKRGGDELQIETDAGSLSHPMAMVHMRHLTHPSRDRRA
ncbi:pyridoxal kinase PdxY [Aquibium sp. ELW1220]|jgi:pyridoxine kinase|uniref:pyridoxal kinase PdxY n=1 Tax=Aquibium sp. ELW1220 TaxID=2976766 RepID=UPI0025B26170|nr:pyridoxal kinase PdxY [Aquibium sp. ELW1220]MDN2582549.1 pyridoxal kinase PdxY [Aquibium sp. ELW1220]